MKVLGVRGSRMLLALRDILGLDLAAETVEGSNKGESGDPKQGKIRNTQASHDAHTGRGDLPVYDDPLHRGA